MGKKLYVGNLSYDVSNEALEEMFAAYGSVQSAQIVMDRDTGRSKGFGFVEMSSDQEAQAAISGLNGKDLNGRSLTVNEARPREDRGGGRSGGGRGFGGGGGGGGGRSGGGRGGYGGREGAELRSPEQRATPGPSRRQPCADFWSCDSRRRPLRGPGSGYAVRTVYVLSV